MHTLLPPVVVAALLTAGACTSLGGGAGDTSPAALARAEDAYRGCLQDLGIEDDLQELHVEDGDVSISFSDDAPGPLVERSAAECEPLLEDVPEVVAEGEPAGERADDDVVRAEAARLVDDFTGVVLVVRDGERLVEAAEGRTDGAAGGPITASTLFDVGSIAKLFTAAAVWSLVESGDVALETTLGDVFPAAPDDKASITVRQLLLHRSGLSEYHDTEGDFEDVDRAEALSRVWEQELRFAPGRDIAYSNTGFTVLAAVVEEVTGSAFEEVVRSSVFEPAGMEATFFYGDPALDAHITAVGQGDVDHLGNDPAQWAAPTWALLGAGGVVSSADDLAAWVQARHDGRLFEANGAPAFEEEVMRSVEGTVGGDRVFAYSGGSDHGFDAIVLEADGGATLAIALTNVARDGSSPASALVLDLIVPLLGGVPAPGTEAVTG